MDYFGRMFVKGKSFIISSLNFTGGSCIGCLHPGPDQLESHFTPGQLRVPDTAGITQCSAYGDREDVHEEPGVAEGA